MRPDCVGDPRDVAAAWFAYLHSGDATEEDRRVFEQWRTAHPEHDRQYCNIQQIWDATLHVPEHELREILARRELPARHPDLVRRRLGWGLAGAGVLALAGGLALYGNWLSPSLQTIEIAVRRGEQRQVRLPDGTVLDVNTGTRAVARLYEDKRVVELLEGEIFFAVQHDAQRPFIVNAGTSRVVVTGTRFNVRYDALLTQVSVESGSVEVSRGAWWNRRSRALSSGQGLDISKSGEALGDVLPRNLDTVLAWQRGKIVFENMPLAQAVTEINRYLEQPVRLEAPALRAHRIAGIFSVKDPHALIDMLPEFAPVRIYRLPDGQVRILAR